MLRRCMQRGIFSSRHDFQVSAAAFCSHAALPNKDILAPGISDRVRQFRNPLEIAVQGSEYVSASANLAFLERDPTECGPRAQLEVESSEMIRDSDCAALRGARIVIKEACRLKSSSAMMRKCSHSSISQILQSQYLFHRAGYHDWNESRVRSRSL